MKEGEPVRILMVNKFLHPNGGSETYMFGLGEGLTKLGHEVQYFGMEHEGRCVGNRVNAYTSNMDFHGGAAFSRLLYPVKTIYSAEARRKLRLVLEDFEPQVIHLNNFNYQLTPSILLEMKRWREQGHRCRIVFTAHDYQLVCPNHLCYNPNTGENCERCLGGHFVNCAKGRCIHGSLAKSAVGTAEALIWNASGVYDVIDRVICCSRFLKTRMDSNPLLGRKTVALHNFVDRPAPGKTEKKDYVLYFGRFSREKGIDTLIRACRALPQVRFIFAGSGPLESRIQGIPNVQNVGFQRGEALETLIRQARFSVYPSECYENCPFSVMESIMRGTPVIGSDRGGIPELIRNGVDGDLFEGGNASMLQEAIGALWADEPRLRRYTDACATADFDTLARYMQKLLSIYQDG